LYGCLANITEPPDYDSFVSGELGKGSPACSSIPFGALASTPSVSAVFAGAVSLATDFPQLLQNLAVEEISLPQCGQRGVS
jgi:hypothetical protein